MRINIKACCAVCLAAAAGLAPAAAAPPRRPSVVLVILDAVRADRTTPYGYAKSATPALAGFAAGATLFENAYAESTWTGTSFATILTGRRVYSHGLAGYLDPLRRDVDTLQSLLSRGGYETAAFFSGLPGEPGYGLTRGFGHAAPTPPTCLFDCQISAALEWEKKLPAGKDYFMAVHGLDVHNPGACAGGPGESGQEMPHIGASFLNYYNDRPDWLLSRVDPEEWKKVLAYKRDPAFRARLSGDYDRCVSQLDKGLDRLLGALAGEGQRPLLLIITSDHGQLLGEHGRIGHVCNIYEPLLRVPLVVRFPGGAAGRRVAGAAGHIDLLPTICAAAGVQAPAGLEGRDLAAAAVGVKRREWAAASGARPPGSPKRLGYAAFYRDGKKLAKHERRWELFDLAADPGEETDLAEALPADFLGLASGYLALSGAETIVRKAPVSGEVPGNCAKPFFSCAVPAGAPPCERAGMRASCLARESDFDGAAAALAGSGCPPGEISRGQEALKLLRQRSAAILVPPYRGSRFSTSPGLWKMTKDGFTVTYGPGGLDCENKGAASAAAGCVAPAAALLDCLEKYRFEGEEEPVEDKTSLEEALRKAGYIQ